MDMGYDPPANQIVFTSVCKLSFTIQGGYLILDHNVTVLKTGEKMVIKTVEPPLGKYSDLVGCWGDIRNDLLTGSMSKTLKVSYYIGEIDKTVVGSMGCYSPKNTLDIGLVEFVQTDEKHRQKGIASALLGKLINNFRLQKGTALFLCTTNPIAGNLYEKHGFWYTVGDGMMYVNPKSVDFTSTYFSYAGKARIRHANWGDLPRASWLYNNPDPNWLLKNYLTNSFRDTRFERHFIQLMQVSQPSGGTTLVLETPTKHVVGLATFHRLPSFYEQHVGTMTFRICSSYQSQSDDLLQALSIEAASIGISTLQVQIADCDDQQKQLVESAGYTETARLQGHLMDGSKMIDMLIYTRQVSSKFTKLIGRGNYYGERQEWQDKRVNTESNN